MIGIYKITSPTGRIYVGQSRDIAKRFAAYKRMDCKSQPKIYNSLKRHGVANHVFEVLELCDEADLNKLEMQYISKYKCTTKGLNVKAGGDYSPCAEETKAKISKAQIGKVVEQRTRDKLRKINLGKKYSDETKQKLSKQRKGNRYALGFKHTSETKAKMKIRQTGRKHSELSKKKISEKNKGKNHAWCGKRKQVTNKLTKEVFESVKTAAESIGMNRKTLNNMLTGHRKNSTNFIYG